MGQDGYTLFSFFVQIPIRKAPKRSRSADLYIDISAEANGEVNSSKAGNETSLPIGNDLARSTKVTRFDIRSKVFLACLLCALPLVWDRWVLDPYDGPTSSINSRKTTTATSAAIYTTTTTKSVTTSDASFQEVEGKSEHSDPQPSTLPPPSTKATTASTTSNSSPLESENKPYISVIQWSHWTDLERMVASIWGGNLFCTTIDDVVQQYYTNHTVNVTVDTEVMDATTNTTSIVPVVKQVIPPDVPIPTIHFDMELSCYDLFTKSTDGTGNYIEAIYMMRLALQYITYGNIQVNLTCSDNTMEFQTNFVLPWFTGVWRSPHYYVNTNHETNDERIQLQGGASVQQLQNMPQSLPKRQYCGSFAEAATGIMYPQMQYDVRRMAIALTVNTRKLQTRPSSQLAKLYPHRAKVLSFLRRNIYYSNNIIDSGQNNMTNTNSAPSNAKSSSTKKQAQHIYADNQQERLSTQVHVLPLIQPQDGDAPIEFDDAVIHFRCGDLLSTELSSYGFLTFDGYSRHISKRTTRTIGILTQPFGTTTSDTITSAATIEAVQARTLDSGNSQQVERCRTLVYAFVEHLQERFPAATIAIRNDKSETIALAYARMVMATQVIGSMSTFSIFPILGTFGTGYYLRPRMYDPSMWLTHRANPVTKFINPPSSFVMFDDENVMVGTQTKDLWDKHGDEVVLEWFRTGNYTLQNT